MASKPNFFDNLWNGAKKIVTGAVGVVGNVVGPIIGVPGLGTMAAGLLGQIKTTDEMAAAASKEGAVNVDKVIPQMAAAGIATTPENVHVVTEGLKKVIANDPNLPQTSPSQIATVGSPSNMPSLMTKITTYIKQNWWLPLCGVVVIGIVIFYFSHHSHGHTKRR